MSSVERRSCGKCENFDRNNIGGEPVGIINLRVNEVVQKVRLGYCRAPRGLSFGVRAEIAECVHPVSKNIPISIRVEVQPESVLA